MSQSIPTGYIPPPPRGLAQKNCLVGSEFDFWKLPGGRAFDKDGDFVEIQSETFRPCIVFISDKYRVSQELLKMGNTRLLISSSNYAKRHINVCSGGDLCSPFFSNFSIWDTLCEDWFWCKDFLRLMNEGRFAESGRFHFFFVFLDFTSTCGEQPSSHTKSKASAYQQLILARGGGGGGDTSMAKWQVCSSYFSGYKVLDSGVLQKALCRNEILVFLGSAHFPYQVKMRVSKKFSVKFVF